MLFWAPIVARHRSRVLQESGGFAPDLILAIIKQESGGVIGKKAGATTKPWEIPSSSGGTLTYNRALGLMQVVPRTLASYNNRNPHVPVYFEQMSGKTEGDARIQIRVGCDVLAKEIRNLHSYDPDSFPATRPNNVDTNQLKCAILGYRMGFGNLSNKLKKLRQRGLALTYKNIKREFPHWGLNPNTGIWINRPIHYTEKIWTNALNHGMVPGSPEVVPPGVAIPEPETSSQGGGLVILALIAMAVLALGSKR